MSDRSIDALEQIEDLVDDEPLQSDVVDTNPLVANSQISLNKQSPSFNSPMVSIHFPKETKVSTVVKSVALWSGECFVMAPEFDRTIQIFSPEPVRVEKAYRVFLSAISVVGLRAVEFQDVIKIVPIQTKLSA